MPLLNDEKHQRWHALSPKDVSYGKLKFGEKGRPVSVITVSRHTIDNEQMTINVPVFREDSRRDLEDRLGLMLSVVQDRMDDANKAWIDVQSQHEEEAKAKKDKK